MKMYPIQDGPSVPYEVMTPHGAQCKKNHMQSIDRIAERGGFSCAEAWAIVNGLDVPMTGPWPWAEWKQNWIAYAERINLHYADLEKTAAKVEIMRNALRELKIRIAYIGMPQEPYWMDGDRKIWDWRSQIALLEAALAL